MNDIEKTEKFYNRYSKYRIMEIQTDRRLQVTSFKQLLKNFNLYDTPSDISDEENFIDKIDHLLKSNLSLYEVKNFYSYLKLVYDKALYQYHNFIEKDFEDIDNIKMKKDEEISDLKTTLQRTTDLLLD